MNAHSTASPRESSYNPWPHALMAFFSLLLAALAGVLWVAFRQTDQLVSSNYYDQEMRYQGRMEALQRTRALGAALALRQEPGQVILQIPDTQAGRRPAGTIRLFRPSDARQDRDMLLATDAAGRQVIDVRGLTAGLWRISVEWTVDGLTYYVEDPMVL